MHGSRWTLMLKKLSTHHVHDRHLCSSGMEIQNVEMDSDLHISRWCQPPQAMTWRYIGGPGPADCRVTSVWRQQSKSKRMWILTSLQLQPEARTPSEWSAVLFRTSLQSNRETKGCHLWHEDAAEKHFDRTESCGGDVCCVAAHGSAGECTNVTARTFLVKFKLLRNKETLKIQECDFISTHLHFWPPGLRPSISFTSSVGFWAASRCGHWTAGSCSKKKRPDDAAVEDHEQQTVWSFLSEQLWVFHRILQVILLFAVWG